MWKFSEEENFRKFLEGTFWIKGWNARAKEILQQVPSEQKAEIESLLSELGKKIGREWAKEKNVRKIDSVMLQNWGKAIKAVALQNPQQIVRQLRRLEQEVNNIL
jgi:predicted hydrocarbon binding protein